MVNSGKTPAFFMEGAPFGFFIEGTLYVAVRLEAFSWKVPYVLRLEAFSWKAPYVLQ